MYADGQGVARDLTRAAHLLEKAAAQGFEPAIAELARLKAAAAGAPPPAAAP